MLVRIMITIILKLQPLLLLPLPQPTSLPLMALTSPLLFAAPANQNIPTTSKRGSNQIFVFLVQFKFNKILIHTGVSSPEAVSALSFSPYNQRVANLTVFLPEPQLHATSLSRADPPSILVWRIKDFKLLFGPDSFIFLVFFFPPEQFFFFEKMPDIHDILQIFATEYNCVIFILFI